MWDPLAARVVRILGPDPAELDALRDQVLAAVRATGAAAESADVPARPSVEVVVDPERAAELGVTPSAATEAMAAEVDGVPVGALSDGTPVVVQVGPGGARPEAMRVVGSNGSIPIADVADVRVGVDRAVLRVDRERATEVMVTGQVDLQPILADLRLPPGYRVELPPER